MTDLFWPGDERAGAIMSDAAFLSAMVRVEQAWLAVLVENGIAPADAQWADTVGPENVAQIAAAAEAGGNPVIPLVSLLRERADPATSPWIHRGLTSQDVVDTALMLCLRDAATFIGENLARQITSLSRVAETHRGTVMAGRTLTQYAVPITFGLKAANWMTALIDAAELIRSLRWPVQIGGAAGTLAAIAELGDPAALSTAVAHRLDLEPASPWHTSRRPVTAIGDAFVTAVDAWARVATDVATLSRPEIGELGESAPGGSSTMPHKQNPVLSTLLRRTGLTAPPLVATLHTAAALAGDERPDGVWHAEWTTLRTLARQTATSASQASDLIDGLQVHDERMSANTAAAGTDLLAERDSLAESKRTSGNIDYLGATGTLIDRALSRATKFLGQSS